MTQRSAPAWLSDWEYAHRGLHSVGVPENSLEAAELAIERGLGIECDIQMSRDSIPMVFHDWDLNRLTGRSGAVAECDAEALGEMRLLGSQEPIVSLVDLLTMIRGRVPLLIEVKSLPGSDIVGACEAFAASLSGYTGQHAVMSFDPGVAAWFFEYDPARVRGLVGTDSYPNGFEGMWRDTDVLKQAAPDFLAVDVRDLDRPEAAEWRASGKPLLTWTVRTSALRTKALAQADALISEGEGLA